MIKNRVNSLILADKKTMKGFIATRDILWALLKKSKAELSKIEAIEISPKKIITIKPTATVEEAIKKMKKSKFHRLPVTENGELLGIITISDVLSFYPQASSELSELDFIREESKKIKRVQQASGREIVKDGICEECGERGPLYRENGMLVCASCLSSM
jgi:CBS domain containing-hemolysin-like protein